MCRVDGAPLTATQAVRRRASRTRPPSPIRDNAAGSGTAGAKNWISAAPGLAPLAATTCHLTNWAVTGVSLTVVKSAALVGLAAAGLITSKVVLPVPKFGSLLKVRVESVTLS